MRVAIVSSTFPQALPGGVATYVEGRATQLLRSCDVRVFALGDLEHADDRHVVLGSRRDISLRPLRVWWRLLRELWHFQPARIEVHNIPVGLPVLIFWRAAYFFHGPAALEAHFEGAGPVQVAMRGWLEQLVMWRAQKVYVASDAYASLVKGLYRRRFAGGLRLLRRYPRFLMSRMAVGCTEPAADAGAAALLMPGPQVATYGIGRPVASDHPLVLVCVRRLVRRSGVLELVEAFARSARAGRIAPGTVLHIIGDGPMRAAIETCAAGCAGDARVVVHGQLSDAGRNRFYRMSDVNIVPSQALEGFGLVVVEAALHGCPSLVTNVGALPEVIAKLDHIGTVCERDTLSLGEALTRLRRLVPSERAVLAQLAQRRFAARPPRLAERLR